VIGFDIADGDIAEKGSLNRFLEQDIFYVFHLAAKTFVPESWKDPFDFYRINVLGTLNVLEFCRQTGSGLTYISSYLYGEPEYLPIDENHPLKAYNPYTHSKLLAEETCCFYEEKFNLSMTIIRPFNIYGPHQPPHFLISEIIGKIFNPSTDKIELMDLKPRRDYVFLDDLVNALFQTIDGPRGIYNLGSGFSVSVGEIANMLIELTGCRKSLISKGISRPNEVFELYANISRIRNKLGWEPKISLWDGLKVCLEN